MGETNLCINFVFPIVLQFLKLPLRQVTCQFILIYIKIKHLNGYSEDPYRS